jgi:hypothetical protein
MSRKSREPNSHGGGTRAYPLNRILGWALAILSLTTGVRAQGQNVEVVGQIGGLCYGVHVQGHYAYIGEGPNLRILDVSNPASPVPVGGVLLPDFVQDVYVSGNLAYVANFAHGLQIIDVSDPMRPLLRGSYSTWGALNGVHVSGNLAYVTESFGGLLIIDVSDPTQPVWRGSNDWVQSHPDDIDVSGSLAYVADGYRGLLIIDVSNPSQPVLRGACDTPGTAHGVYLRGNLVYVADGESGLQIIDVSDPTHPVWRGSYDTPGTALRVSVSGNLACVADFIGFQIIDVSDPSQPVWRGAYSAQGCSADGVYVTGNLAYVAHLRGGLQILDVSDPTQPVLRGGYTPLGYAEGLCVSGGLAYVADQWMGLQIIDVSDPTQPVSRATCPTPGDALDVYVSRGLACVAGGNSGLQIIDVTDPAQPVLRGAYDTSGSAWGVYVSDSLAYVADGSSGLQIIDVSDPAQPVLRGSYDTSGTANGVYVSGGLAYVAGGGLQIVDVTDPTQPIWRGSYGMSDGAFGVYVRGNLAYLVGGVSLEIIDVSDPTQPIRRGSCGTRFDAQGVCVSGNLAYVASNRRAGGGSQGCLEVVDVSNPTQPVRRGTYQTVFYPVDVYTSGGLVYVAEDLGGLWIFRYTGTSGSAAPSNLTATVVSTNQINLSWTDNSDNEDGFKIERRSGATGWWAQIALTAANATTRTDTGLLPGTTYFYRVRAANPGGDSDYSNETSATTPAMPMFGHLDPVAQMGGGFRAVQVAGHYAYCAEGYSLVIVDVSNPDAPQTVGRLLTKPLSWVMDVFTTGGVAYVAAGPNGLQIADVSDPTSPSLLGSHPTTGTANAVYVSGNTAYVAASDLAASGALFLFNVAVPSSPALLARYDTAQGAADVVASGGLAYVAAGDFLLVDVSVPALPMLRGVWPGDVSRVFVSGRRAYVSGSNSPLYVLDVSNPSSPTLQGTFPTEGGDVYVSGNTAYLAEGNGMDIVDVGDPTSPTLLGAYATWGPIMGVWSDGNVAYLASLAPFHGRLSLVDVSHPASPTLRSFVGSLGECYDVSIEGGIGGVGTFPQNLYAVGTVRPTAPAYLGVFDSQWWDQGIRRVRVSGNRCYVAATGKLNILDLSTPTSPTFVSAAVKAQDVFVRGNLAYVANSVGLTVYDVTDPSSPTTAGTCLIAGGAQAVHVDGNLACVAGSNHQIHIVDVGNPALPALRGSCSVSGSAKSLYVSGNFIYVTVASANLLEIVDASDPLRPTVRGSFAAPAEAWDVEVSDGLAYLTSASTGKPGPGYLQVIDVRNPAAPALRAFHEFFWDGPTGVQMDGGMAYVATFGSGLWVFRYSVLISPPAAPSNLTATADSSVEITLRWQDNSDNEDGFRIERKTGFSGAWSEITTAPANTAVYHDPGLTPNTAYSYRLRAHNAAGDSGYSNEVSATTLDFPPVPPSNLTATAVSPTQIHLGWQDNSYNENGFNIERKVGSDGVWTPIASVAGTTYDDTNGGAGLSPGATYFYRVQAWNLGGVSAYSNETSATTPIAPGGVNLVVSNGDFSPVAPVQVMPNGPIALSAFIENRGADAAGPFWTEVWGSRTGGLTLDRFLAMSLRLPDGLPGGGSYSWATSTSLYGVPDGPYTVVYAVDRPGEVAESNERDNRAVVRAKRLLVIRPQTVADLAVENFGMTPNPAQSGGQVSFSGRVVNRGRTITGRFWIEFWGSWDWPYPNLNFFLCDSIFVENLNPGTWVDLSAYPRQLYDVPEGVFMVGCFADRDDSLSESDETNNYQFVDGQVLNRASLESRPAKAGAGADIVVRSADVSPVAPAQLAPGDTITLTIEVANIGTADTGPFWLEYWGSRDGGVTLADFLADSTRFANLAPGQTVRLSTVKRLYGIPDGPYSVVVFADRPQDVSETDEANNRLTVAGKRLLVIRPPTGANLALENFGCNIAGATIALDGTVRNTGGGDSGPFWIEFWACPGDPDYPWLDRYLCDSVRVNNLARGGELSLGVGRATYLLPAGTYVVIAFVDRLDQVAETDETDNYAIVRGVAVTPH